MFSVVWSRTKVKEHGRLLPVSEGSVRPLLEELREDRQLAKKKLKLDDLRIKAWDDAVLMKQKSTPTGTDVRRAVRSLDGTQGVPVGCPGSAVLQDFMV
jgi:hypothetical protein